MTQPHRLGCLISGGGRTVLNLQSEIERGDLNAEIATVVAHRSDLAGVDRCRAAGLAVEIIPTDAEGSLSDRIDHHLRSHAIDLVCLCGYLRHFHVSPEFADRVINIHPSLLPRFGGRGMYGMRVHEAVIDSGERESGCTVHLVDEVYDHGPILHQRRCPVHSSDDATTLAARVFEEETRAFPEVIDAIAAGDLRIHGGVVQGGVRSSEHGC